jgi:hypothetical protein
MKVKIKQKEIYMNSLCYRNYGSGLFFIPVTVERVVAGCPVDIDDWDNLDDDWGDYDNDNWDDEDEWYGEDDEWDEIDY